ncbi:MAG: tetratricopeptide repeat protein, partial [Gammaproteobacteria bacterium]|nr:tetratricopeptide repeat protein [Gammaproteobacteria bacterium]
MRIRITIFAVISLIVFTACGGKDATLPAEGPDSNEEALYEAAQKNMRIGNYPRAIGMIDQLELFFPFSEYTRRARLDVIYANYKVGN